MSQKPKAIRIVRPVFYLLLVMWVIHGVNALAGYNLNAYFGLYPRRAIGLPGIITSTFLHSNISHLLANSTPLLVLGLIKAGVLRSRFWTSTLLIIVISGCLLWLFGRPNSVHIGASGLVFGYFGLLIALGLFERSLVAVVGALAAIALYGGLIWGVFGGANISWEGHIFGIIGGVLTAILIARRTKRS